ncbi:uncharacterized protein METZ01_LOCUS457977 [marine metagenome]|uniref:Uncharacterized protein n=1 Tax=marine metagenome TaxID=408172 RepID=A0A383ABZ5_9ZZZZ
MTEQHNKKHLTSLGRFPADYTHCPVHDEKTDAFYA